MMMRWTSEAGFGPNRRGRLWPGFDDARRASRQRAMDAWEQEHEPFEGATALGDLASTGDDVPRAALVLARFTAARLALRAAMGAATGHVLREEKEAAAAYLAAATACSPAEREALEAVLRLAAHPPPRVLTDHLEAAGEAAAAQGHDAGARALHGTGYQLALARGWTVEAARAAGLMARRAGAAGSRRAYRRWRWRAAVLGRRAAGEG